MLIKVLERYSKDAKEGRPKKLIETLQQGVLDVSKKHIIEQFAHCDLNTLIKISGYDLAKKAFLNQMNDYYKEHYYLEISEEDALFSQAWQKAVQGITDEDFGGFEESIEPAYFEISLEEGRDNTLLFPTLRKRVTDLSVAMETYESTKEIDQLLEEVKRFDEEVERIANALDGADTKWKHAFKKKFSDDCFVFSEDHKNENLLERLAQLISQDEIYTNMKKQADALKPLMNEFQLTPEDSSIEFYELDLVPDDDTISDILREVFPNAEASQRVIEEISNRVFDAALLESSEFLEEMRDDVSVSYGYTHQYFVSPKVELLSIEEPFMSIDQKLVLSLTDGDEEYQIVEDGDLSRALEYGLVEIDAFDDYLYGLDAFKDYKEQLDEIIEYKKQFDQIKKRLPELVRREIDLNYDRYEEMLNEE